jgi:uncharacterized protein (UPF0276 family)
MQSGRLAFRCFQTLRKETFNNQFSRSGVAGMDEVITRIVEIERQCSVDVEQAQLEYAEHIEAHKRILEESKTQEFARITAAENTRLSQAILEAKRKTEAVSAIFRKDTETLFQDQSLNKAIQEGIISILLEG